MKYFVSDFHFGAAKNADNPILEQFENFCACLSNGDELYILGDFFDFWIEYASVVRADYVRVYSVLLNARKCGIEIFFVRGNHDFMRGNFLQDFGIKVFDKSAGFDFNGKKFFCTHGDNVSPNWVRTTTRFFSRNGFFQNLYKLLHPDFAVWLAQTCSELSRKKTAPKASLSERKEKYRKFASDFFGKNDYDVLIMGHSHIEDLTKNGAKIYANCGVWFENPTYILLDKNKLFLKKFGGDLRKDIILEEKEL